MQSTCLKFQSSALHFCSPGSSACFRMTRAMWDVRRTASPLRIVSLVTATELLVGPVEVRGARPGLCGRELPAEATGRAEEGRSAPLVRDGSPPVGSPVPVPDRLCDADADVGRANPGAVPGARTVPAIHPHERGAQPPRQRLQRHLVYSQRTSRVPLELHSTCAGHCHPRSPHLPRRPAVLRARRMRGAGHHLRPG